MGPENNAVVPGTLHASWRVETGGQISASPTVADDTLYVGNNNGSLYAIDVNTGKILWKAHVPNPLMSAPLIYDDLVIVGEGDPTSRNFFSVGAGHGRPRSERADRLRPLRRQHSLADDAHRIGDADARDHRRHPGQPRRCGLDQRPESVHRSEALHALDRFDGLDVGDPSGRRR